MLFNDLTILTFVPEANTDTLYGEDVEANPDGCAHLVKLIVENKSAHPGRRAGKTERHRDIIVAADDCADPRPRPDQPTVGKINFASKLDGRCCRDRKLRVIAGNNIDRANASLRD